MAQCILEWTPGAGTNTLNQTIQYKLTGSTTWITFNTVGPTVYTALITGIQDNKVYDFRIIDNCSTGGPTASAVIKGIKFICPTVTLSPSFDTAQFDFLHAGGDVNKYLVELLNTSNAVIASKPINSPTTNISDLFTGLVPSTSYNIRVTMYAGSSFEYNKTCTAVAFVTTAAPTCNAPTAVTATIS